MTKIAEILHKIF